MAKYKEQLMALWVLIARPRWWKEDGYYSSIDEIVKVIRLMDIQSVDEFWRCEHYSQFSDLHKDVVGVRPRPMNWRNYSIKDMEAVRRYVFDMHGSPFEEE
jgi:hypothetical protein